MESTMEISNYVGNEMTPEKENQCISATIKEEISNDEIGGVCWTSESTSEHNYDDMKSGREDIKVEVKQEISVLSEQHIWSCDGLLDVKNDLQSTEISDHQSDNLYKCVKCSYQTAGRRNFRRHMNFKHNEHCKIHTCKNCTFKTKFKSCLIRHVRKKHEQLESGKEDVTIEIHKQVVKQEVNVSNELDIRSPGCETLVDVKEEVDEYEISELGADLKLEEYLDKLGCKSQISDEQMSTDEMLFNCKIEMQNAEIKLERSWDENVPNIFPVKTMEETSEMCLAEIDVSLESSTKDRQSIETSDRESNGLYKCMHCSYQTTGRRYFVKHINFRHSPYSKVYNCDYCPYETRNRNYLMKHINMKHDITNVLYKCQECAYETKIKFSLTEHIKLRHDTNSVLYKCTDCTYETKSKIYLKKHIKRRHGEGSLLYNCPNCTYQATVKCNLRRHMKVHEVNCVLFKCNDCPYEAKRKSDLTEHVRRRHDINGVLFKCTDCKYETKCKIYLQKHIKKKHGVDGVVYKCEDCTYEAKHHSCLKKHIKRNHDVNCVLHKCKECTYETKCKSDLKKHVNRKHEVNCVSYKCKDCTYETRYKFYLKEHVKRVHEVISILHKCTDCTYETTRRASLVNHMRKHKVNMIHFDNHTSQVIYDDGINPTIML